MNVRKNPSPPRWALRLVKWLCPDDLYEMIEGDLMEEFQDNLIEYGGRGARLRFALSTVRFIHPYLLRLRISKSRTNPLNMISHHVTSALRHLRQRIVLSSINIIGLAVGITAFFLIARYVSFETSFDSFHSNAEQIYRVSYIQKENDEVTHSSARNFMGIPALIRENLPEVTACTSFDHTAQKSYFKFEYKGKNFHYPGAFYQTDEHFFQVFPSLLQRGDAHTVLADPHNIVISEKIARQLFGEEDPIGKRLDNRSYWHSQSAAFTVTGVMIDVPENAHFHLDFIVKDSFEDEFASENFWTEPRFYTYITIGPEGDPTVVKEKLNLLLDNLGKENPKLQGISAVLQPIRSIHSYSNLAEELEPNGNASLLLILSVVGIAVLICACINYVNIESGSVLSRFKETGVRRVLGATRTDLVAQFFIQYLITTFLAIGLSAITWYSFPAYTAALLGSSAVDLTQSFTWQTACLLFGAIILISGIFPTIAFVRQSSGAKARSNVNQTAAKPWRRNLVIFQFTCSISLIAIVMIVTAQLQLLTKTNKKIDVNNIISFNNPTVYTDEDSVAGVDFNSLESELLRSSLITRVTGSSAVPGMEVEVSFVDRIKRNLGDPFDPTPYKILFVDYEYIPFYNVRLVAGRNYSIERGDDQSWNTVILNESAVRAMGFKNTEEAIDKEFYFHLFGSEFKKYRIIGVVEDYYHKTAKDVVQPTVLSLNHRYFQQVFFSVKLANGADPYDALNTIERTWKKMFPDKPFEYFFQDEFYDRQFKTERRFGNVFGLFAGIAALIACLGIVGMTLFDTHARMKEVSIRKVLGATVANLVGLLSSAYLRIVLLASIGCVPIILVFSSTWLKGYAIKIETSIWFIVIPVGIVILLVAVSSGWQTMKVALSNPVDNLKRE